MITPVLDTAEVRERLARHGEVLRRYGVTSVAVFGSVARGEAFADSDVDLLVAFGSGAHRVADIE